MVDLGTALKAGMPTSTPLKGSYSARVPNTANSYLREDFSSASDLYVAFYLRVDALKRVHLW